MSINKLPKIALGAWSWGAGAAGGGQVFGNYYFEEDLKPVFDTAWAIAKGTLPIIGVTKVYQVHEAAKTVQIELTADELATLEALADKVEISTLREWEKEMV